MCKHAYIFLNIFIVIKYLIIKALYEKMCELLSKHKFNKQENLEANKHDIHL